MGALRNPLPDTPPTSRRKPVQAERKNYTYDRERIRKSSGYGIMPDSAWADLPRLTRSNTFTLLVIAILRYAGFESGGTKPQSLKSCNAFTEAIPDEFWANCCGADVRELQRNLDYGTRSGVLERQKVGKTHSRLRLVLENWATLPSYKEWLAANLHEVAESDDEPETEDPARNNLTNVRLLKSPAAVRPGKACRPMKINTGVRSLSLDWSKVPALPGIALMYLPEIKAGDLVVHLSLDQSLANKVSGEDGAKPKRHACRDVTQYSPSVRQSRQRRIKGEDLTCTHPLAGKLCGIFNPILEKSRLSMLEANQQALNAACEAMGDLSINDLIEFLCKGRARRQISSHRHIALVIGDARRDRDARAKLDTDGVAIPDLKPEKKAGFAERLKAEAKRRLDKYGRI